MIGEIIFGTIMILICLAVYWCLYFRTSRLEEDTDCLAEYADDDELNDEAEEQPMYTARSITLSDQESLSLLKENPGLYNEWKDHKDLCPICMMTHAESFTSYLPRFSKVKNEFDTNLINTTLEAHDTSNSRCSLCGHELEESNKRR